MGRRKVHVIEGEKKEVCQRLVERGEVHRREEKKGGHIPRIVWRREVQG